MNPNLKSYAIAALIGAVLFFFLVGDGAGEVITGAVLAPIFLFLFRILVNFILEFRKDWDRRS